jgi:hypothetical protein
MKNKLNFCNPPAYHLISLIILGLIAVICIFSLRELALLNLSRHNTTGTH